MRQAVNINELSPELQAKLGYKNERKRAFTKEQVRSRALRVLAEIADLSQDQRRQVLEHGLKVNKI